MSRCQARTVRASAALTGGVTAICRLSKPTNGPINSSRKSSIAGATREGRNRSGALLQQAAQHRPRLPYPGAALIFAQFAPVAFLEQLPPRLNPGRVETAEDGVAAPLELRDPGPPVPRCRSW